MPEQTQQAVTWALQQAFEDATGSQVQITKDTPQELVDHVREYLNAHDIEYSTFSYDDLLLFLN